MDYGQMRKWHMRYAHSPYWASWMRFSSFYVLFDYYYYFTFNILVLRMIIGQYHIYIRECGLAINRIGFDVYQISEIRLKPTKLKKLYSYACAHLSIFRFLIVAAGWCFCFFFVWVQPVGGDDEKNFLLCKHCRFCRVCCCVWKKEERTRQKKIYLVSMWYWAQTKEKKFRLNEKYSVLGIKWN